MWMWLFVWFLVLALIFTVPVTINVVMNGSAAVVDVTPRNASEREVISALWPCAAGWGVTALLAFGVYLCRKYRRRYVQA